MATFVKGQSGNPAGSKKGRIIKGCKVRTTAKEILEGLGFEPFKEAVELYRSTKKERIKADLVIDMCNYVAPKLRAIEFKNDSEQPFVVTLNLAPKSKDGAKVMAATAEFSKEVVAAALDDVIDPDNEEIDL